MKLISCHIENFGKLSNLDIDFQDTYNEYVEENGWGKSTLVAFIQAMFYGLSSKGKDIEKNERQRYMPWQGGLFGGRICFKINDKTYILTRYFEKKEKDDIFELRDERTNMISKDYSVAIGEELFGINKDAFCRTVLISQKDCQTVANDSIMAKIGNLTESTDDVNNYETAVNFLAKYLNNQSPTRKTGELYKIVQQIESLRQTIRCEQALNETSDNIGKKKDELVQEQKSLKLLREKLQEKIDIISKKKDLLLKKEKHDLLKKDIKEQFKKIENYKKQFPAGLPDRETIEQHIKESTKAFLLSEKMAEIKLNDKEEQQYLELQSLFVNLTEEEKTFSPASEAKRLEAIDAVLKEKELTPEEIYCYRELQQRFGNTEPDLEEIEACISLWNEIYNRKISPISQEKEEHGAKNGKHGIPIIIAGATGIFSGLLINWSVSKITGIAISVIGLLAVIIGFLLKSKKKSVTSTGNPDEENVTIEEQENMLKEYLQKYSIPYVEQTIASALHQTYYNAKEFLRLSDKQKNYNNSTEVKEKSLIENRISVVMEKVYGDKNGQIQNIGDIVNQYEVQKQQYRDLTEKKESYDKTKTQHDVIMLHIEMYLNTIGFKMEDNTTAQLQGIKEILMLTEIATEGYLKKCEELKKYEEEVDVDAMNDLTEDGNSIEELTEQLKTVITRLEVIQDEINLLNKQLEEILEKKDEIEELKNELEHLKQLKQENEKKYYLAEQTKSCLEKAKLTMTSTFTKPMLDEFSRLYTLITEDDKKIFHMDAETKVTVDEKGMQRDTEYFSTGYKDLYGLCLRLAFIKAMFKVEKPFIVLDDTFVNLDEEKTRKAIQLLEKTSDEYQVLYFTCHKSRAKN